jgi:hypothetical protein
MNSTGGCEFRTSPLANVSILEDDIKPGTPLTVLQLCSCFINSFEVTGLKGNGKMKLLYFSLNLP